MMLAGVLCSSPWEWSAGSSARMEAGDAPTGFANAIESVIVFFRDNVVRANIGHGADQFAPFILTLFFFILYMNLLGLIPFGVSASASLSVTAALAFLAFLWIEVAGFRAWVRPGTPGRSSMPPGSSPGGQAVMLLIMTPVEAIGKLTKPFALAIRLFANMTAGKILILSLLGLFSYSPNSPSHAGASPGERW
jgi:F-type H+-transporting ATPase subunit a